MSLSLSLSILGHELNARRIRGEEKVKKVKQRTWLVKYVENWKKEKNYETPSPEFQREHGERKLIIVIIGRGFYSKFKLNTFRIFFFPSFTGIKKKKK